MQPGDVEAVLDRHGYAVQRSGGVTTGGSFVGGGRFRNAASRRAPRRRSARGLTASIRACSISVSSREENSLRPTACAASVADWNSGVSLIFFASVQFVTIASWNSVRYVSLFSPSSIAKSWSSPGWASTEMVAWTRIPSPSIRTRTPRSWRSLRPGRCSRSPRRVMSKIST